jgi:hypothetical protein
MESLNPPDAGTRAEAFLRYVAENRDNPLTTVWGAYGNFDCMPSPCWLSVTTIPKARRLLRQTLDMIEQNFADERGPIRRTSGISRTSPCTPLLRAYFQVPE